MQTRRFTFNELKPAFASENCLQQVVRLPVGSNLKAGQVLGCTGVVARNDLKTITITGSPTGGTWTFSFLGQTSDAIAYNANAAAVQAACDKFFGKGNTLVAGGPGPGTAWTITFTGSMASVLVKSLTVTGAFTGGTSPAIAAANTTPGSAGAAQMDAYDNSAIATATCLLAADYASDINGGVLTERGGTGTPFSARAYFDGPFNVADLTGLDANAVTDMGRMIFGTAYDSAGGVLKIN